MMNESDNITRYLLAKIDPKGMLDLYHEPYSSTHAEYPTEEAAIEAIPMYSEMIVLKSVFKRPA